MKLTAAYCIEQVLIEENRPMFLHEIRQAIVDKFGEWHSESAISARIRDTVRPSLKNNGITLISKAPKGKSAHQYSLIVSHCVLVGKFSYMGAAHPA